MRGGGSVFRKPPHWVVCGGAVLRTAQEGVGGWGYTCVRGPLAARFGPISCRWRAERSANATVSPVFAPVAVLPAFEGPPSGPSAPVPAPFRLRRSIHWTLDTCFGAIPALKVHPLDPRLLFRRRLRRSAPWTLDDTILVAAKRLIISKMLIILGAKWNEDFHEVAE